ncbi:MAG: DUF167 family protein [Bauldia sp.]|nr:DUF167 family protein [Bauldia sp.]
MAWYRKERGAIVLGIRLTPKADRDAFAGIAVLADGREVAKVRVRALPEDGAANDALVRLIARSLRLPKSAVNIVGGASQRLKQVRVAGDPDELASKIEDAIAK